jgi:hypothetical protein
MKLNKFFLLLILLFFFYGCNDNIVDPNNPSDNPEIIITNPSDSTVISNGTYIRANVYNISNVKKVKFYLNGQVVFEDSVSPYEYYWNVYYWENMRYSILVEAEDNNKNIWKSKLLSVFLYKDTQLNVSLIKPENNRRITNTNNIDFSWHSMTDANHYIIDVASDQQFLNIILHQESIDTSITINNFAVGSYFWRIKATSVDNLSGNWSGIQKFIISNPDSPLLLFPENNSVMKNGTSPDLIWNKSEDAILYEYQLSNNNDFTQLLLDEETTDTIKQYSNYSLGSYYWRIRCKNSAGFWSEWSNYFSFGVGVFSKIYGGSDLEYGKSIIETPDQGFLILGQTFSYGRGVSDVYLIKTDEMGNVLWSKTYGTPNEDRAEHMQLTLDGGIIIIGTTASIVNGYNSYNIYLIKTDSYGNLEWEKEFGGDGHDFGYGICETSDGGFILTGNTMVNSSVYFDAWIIKTDNLGNQVWDKIISYTMSDQALFVTKAQGVNYLITGIIEPNASLAFLMSIDGYGNENWFKTYSGGPDNRGKYITILSNTDIVIAGNRGSSNMLLLCTDSDGNEKWNKILDPGFGSSVLELNNTLISTGFDLYSTSNVFINKTDFTGNMIWTKNIGGNGHDTSSELIKTSDGGFAMVGTSSSFGNNQDDIWFVKFNKDGSSIIK